MSDEGIEKAVKDVLSQVPGAEENVVREEFLRYQKEFLIPPADALRSVMRKVQSKTGAAVNVAAGSSGGYSAAPMKKVARLDELGPDDRNIVIEVRIISHNPRTQTVRGEERDIAFGMLEDNPWGGGSERARWDYKDWGPHQNIAPGAILRIEGASVNEYQGKRSLNINQSSRVVVLQEGERVVIDHSEPITISEACKSDGMVTIIGRVLTRRDDVIKRRDGTGTIDVVKGRIADDSGAVGFVSWEPFTHEVGTLLKIEKATVRRFRDTPELNFGRTTKAEIFHDTNFADAESLEDSSVLSISELRDGAREVSVIAQLQSLTERRFTNSEGEEKKVMAGELIDPTGRCRLSAWCDLDIDESELPLMVRLERVRVRAWQGIPDITVDEADQLVRSDADPFGDIDPETHVVEASLAELSAGTSRVGISTEATVVSVRDDCGVIWRCPECRRVLRDDNCAIHGSVQGNRDIRLRLVIDDSRACASLIVAKDPALAFLNLDLAALEERLSKDGQPAFVQSLRTDLLGRNLNVKGRTIVDEQGMMVLADNVEKIEVDATLAAAEARTKWGVA